MSTESVTHGKDAGIKISIKPMGLSDGRCDYFVAVAKDGREVTPHVFRERFKAEYHVALYRWLFEGGDEPDIMDFDEGDWPARTFTDEEQRAFAALAAQASQGDEAGQQGPTAAAANWLLTEIGRLRPRYGSSSVADEARRNLLEHLAHFARSALEMPTGGGGLPDRCPQCRMSWSVFRPATVSGSNAVRCLECKHVLTPSFTAEEVGGTAALLEKYARDIDESRKSAPVVNPVTQEMARNIAAMLRGLISTNETRTSQDTADKEPSAWRCVFSDHRFTTHKRETMERARERGARVYALAYVGEEPEW